MNDLTKEAYPWKRNQEHMQQQEECNQTSIDHNVVSHKSRNDETIHGHIESKQKLKVA
jgi:response regulator of citrate/malate metabolism